MVKTKVDVKKDEHVVPRDEGWGVKIAGGERASKVFKTKDEAIKFARELAIKHNVCMVFHDDKAKFEGFECDPELIEKYMSQANALLEESEKRNQHVVQKFGGWAVVSAGGKNVSSIFPNKGAAMAHAYEIATRDKVCMLVHDSEGRFKTETCSPDETPGILEVIRMRMKM